ncbi:MAG: RIO1 family regulatory kinase/ATPase [Rhodothermales bacterium]|nr:RIO1 family regulatory kinase/ATPase [Rhodothermales bacterium]
MRWPTAVDYQAALQAPGVSFQDSVLREGIVRTDPLGMPVVMTGNVAAAFRMEAGGREVAIRCFTRSRDFQALARRYEALSALQQRTHMPGLAACRYLPEGLLVGTRAMGIVEMEWIDGLHLHRYVARHVDRPEALRCIAEQWRVMMARLETARLAHGDLSDGNVLVDAAGRVRLIDYDGIYLPELAGLPSGEMGKTNYQHPARLREEGRGGGYFGENMDAFAALVIYLSLLAVADDLTRWPRYHVGDNLIFRQDDFEAPGATPIWDELAASDNRELQRLADALADYCTAPIETLPPLEHTVSRNPGHEVRPPSKPSAPPSHSAAAPAPERHTSAAPREPARAPHWLDVLRETPATEPERTPVPVFTDDRPPTRWIWPRMGGLSLIALAALLAAGAMWATTRPQPALSRYSPEPIQNLAPADLEGFYTGVAGTAPARQDPVALTLEEPERVHEEDQALFRYHLNWRTFSNSGRARYDPSTGRIQLGEQIELVVGLSDADELVLTSLETEGQGTWMQVRRRR